MSKASELPDALAAPSTSYSPSVRVRRKWNSLLAASLEVWCHQILYTRNVYPRDVFKTTQFLGVRCFVCRHPSVASYISNTISVAAAAFRDGVSTEIIFSIIEDIDNRTKNNERSGISDPNQTDDVMQRNDTTEIYTIKVTNHRESNSIIIDDDDDKSLKVKQVIQNLERAMRDLILRVLRFDTRIERSLWSDSVSFRVSLHIPVEKRTCQDLNIAFAAGKWCENLQGRSNIDPSDTNEKCDRRIVIRPLHQAVTPMGVFHFTQRRVVASPKPKASSE